jgi:Ribosome-associated protein Y (PSrp-1)
MDHPFVPTLLSESIVFRDINVGLAAEARIAAFEKIARLLQHDADIARIRIDMTRDDQTTAEDDRYVAKGELDLGGPTLLASVASHDPLRALDFLIERFDGQLLRRRTPARAGGR